MHKLTRAVVEFTPVCADPLLDRKKTAGKDLCTRYLA